MQHRRNRLLVSLIVAVTLVAPAFVAVSAAAAETELPVHLIDGIPGFMARPDKNPGHGGGSSDPPAQPDQVTPWGIDRVNASLVWQDGFTGENIIVAVVDTGIQPDHPDLKDKIIDGTRFYSRGNNLVQDDKWADDHGHGTHVAGTIAALDNTIGVVGVAPDVQFLAVKVLDRNGAGSWASVAAGIVWATDNGADIISMSLGGSGGNSVLASAVSYAESAGVIVVAAAGNSGDGKASTTETSYPAAYPGVIAVGATDSDNQVASFSSSAGYISVCGPGVSVFSTYKGSSYATMSGTSMATPHVSGSVALLLDIYDVNPADDSAWDSESVGEFLADKAVDLGVDTNFCGGGLVDASLF